MKRFFKILLLSFIALFILIQLYPRPAKNIGNPVNLAAVSITGSIPEAVSGILKTSCYDCHSDHTNYPWYAAIQPVAWWLGDHITEGKKELNFSIFETYSLRKKFKKFEEIIDEVEEDKMPLQSYTRLHADARLSPGQKEQVVNWARAEYDAMKKKYPADSLAKKK